MATIVQKETDARFWATGYRPGHKLDPNDPQDALQIPVWLDIQKKVQAEAAAGTLVTTFDHPVVAKNLADSQAASQAAGQHLSAAQKAPDPATAQQHVDAAAAATTDAQQKAQEAAKLQPQTASPQLKKEAAQQAAAQPLPANAPADQHIAQAQAINAHKPQPDGILKRETDARYWLQTHYKVGQRLDPSNPQDAAMIPVWNDVYAKVKAEDAAGTLVLTYNSPVVIKAIADAQAADHAAGAHLDAAAANPQAAPQHVAAASNAVAVSAQRSREGAAVQPPTVNPRLAHEAGHPSDRDRVVQATYQLFWERTHYRPGHMLDPRDPSDARMIPVWMSMHAEVERRAGHSGAGRDHVAAEQARRAGSRAEEVHRRHSSRGGRKVRSATSRQSLQSYRAQTLALAQQAGAPFVLVTIGLDGQPHFDPFPSREELDAAYAQIAEHHDQYAYVAAFDLGASAGAPVIDSVGVGAAEHVEPPPADAGMPSGAGIPSPDGGGPPPSGDGMSALTAIQTQDGGEPPKKSHFGWIALGIGGAVAALFFATRRKGSRGGGVPRTPRVVINADKVSS